MARLTKEQISGAEFSFNEEEVEVPQLGGDILLRELNVGRRSSLLDGLIDKDGNVKDSLELQCRTFSAACVDPVFTPKEARGFIPKWPATVLDTVFEAINERLGGVSGKEEAAEVASEFPASD